MRESRSDAWSASADDRSSNHATVWDVAALAFSAWGEGSAAALDQLVEAMTPVLWHTVRAYGLAPETAEDVVQATWVALLRNADRVRDPQAVAGWLLTTARREAWQATRLAGRAVLVSPEEVFDALDLVPTESPEDLVIRASGDDELWGAVDGLPERCRRLLRLVAFTDRPDYRELAEHLQVPVGSVGPTRQRCLAKLRTALAESRQG